MDSNNSQLTIHEYPFGLWLAGLFLGGVGAWLYAASPGQWLFTGALALAGLVLFLAASALTVTADRTTGLLTLRYRNILLLGSKKEIPISEITAIQVEMSRSQTSSSHRNSSGPSYRVVIVRRDGQVVPFHSYYSSGALGKQRQAEKLRSFLGVGGMDESVGGLFKMAGQMAQQKFTEQQEALTGSQAAEQVTSGVHWRVQTVTFGASPVTRWYSPDYRCPEGFVFLAQKVEGQRTMGGGLMGGLGKMLFQQSMGLYGFSSEDTPGLQTADILQPLDPYLEPHFSAFTSSPGTARSILNSWVTTPLADWATRYPLKQVQKQGVFGQLAVMFSPRGVYIASLGTMIPEAVQELTTLGVELIRAQGAQLRKRYFMVTSNDISRYRHNLQKEVDGSYLYDILSASEKQPAMAELYHRLALSEQKHAAAWQKQLKDVGKDLPLPKPAWRARTLGFLAKRFGARFILPTLTGGEQADGSAYGSQPEDGTRSMSADERSHARLLTAAGGSTNGLSGGIVAQMEGRHKASGGNALRAAVLGANDGLVSILSLVMGVAGANLNSHDIFIAGIAGLLAGAGSMALGEWLSVQSSRELYSHQILIEKEELENSPAEEQEELALIYQAKGLSQVHARQLSEAIMKTEKDSIIDTLAREELGIDPQELGGSAYVAAATSFFLFAIGALFPLLPFALLQGNIAVYTSMGVSALALFMVGAAITLMTGRSVLYSGFRQVIIGLAAAIITYGVGRLIGVSISG